MGDGHARAARLRREGDLDLRRSLGTGRNEEIEQDTARQLPGSDMAELDLVPIARALVEAAAREQEDLARGVFGMAAIRRPPFADLLGEELERRARSQRQQHGLD